MPKLDSFEIQFDNPLAVYYAGAVLNGTVHIVLNQPMEMRGVRLSFGGKAHTAWTERHKTGDRDVTDYYTGDESYFDQEITLWGNQRGSNGSALTMPAGVHNIPFAFPIPFNCPSSFEGQWGWIRYVLDARIDRPWKFDHKTKRPFTVLGMYDLNADLAACQPLSTAGQKTLGCLCCTSGRISCQAHVSKRGYVAGELVAVSADISNDSSRRVDAVTMRLVQRVTFRARHLSTRTKESEVTLGQIVKPEAIGPGDCQTWSDAAIRLPPVPLTLMNCSIINISYAIVFKITPSGPSFSLSIELPLTVGSVPLRQQIPQFQQAYRQFSMEHGGGDQFSGLPPSYPAAAAVQPTAPPMGNDYPDLPPPTYAEATTGKVNIKDDTDDEHTRGQFEYTPRYAYYDWSASPGGEPTRSLAHDDSTG